MTVDANSASLLRPIVGIENRTAQEVFDIMCDRFRLAARPAPDHAGLVKRLWSHARDLEMLGLAEGRPSLVREAATALSAASPAPLEGVRVKPLEWDEDQWPRDAASLGMLYRIYGGRPAGNFKLLYPDKSEAFFDTIADAKAAAQADYDRRILSAIVGSAK